MGKQIKGTYWVADCEHNGDVENAKSYLRSLGCNVISYYWDGYDCGEAYITFSFDETKFIKIYKELSGNTVEYSADINNYYKFNTLDDFQKLPNDILKSERNRLAHDLSKDILDNMPIYMFWECSDKISDDEVINKALGFIGTDTKVIGYSYEIVDGCQFCDVLMTTPYTNMMADKFTYGIGDYCLGHFGWFHNHGIYGECRPVHDLYSWFNYYDEFQKAIKLILNGKDLKYKSNGYYGTSKMFTKEDYLDKEGNLLNKISFEWKDYFICRQN